MNVATTADAALTASQSNDQLAVSLLFGTVLVLLTTVSLGVRARQ